MGKKSKEKQKLTGGWESLQTVIWLLGLAIIAWEGWWWPGILVLVAISVMFEGLIKVISPDSFVTVKKEGDEAVFDQPNPAASAQPDPQPSPVIPAWPAPQPVHRTDLLPTNCPKCGGPTRAHEVKWTGAQSADCPYCGANLPMKSV